MILADNNTFVLSTKNTTYAFRIMRSGHGEHLYYGRKIDISLSEDEVSAMTEKHEFAPGNTVNYDKDNMSFSMEDACLELSAPGKGDVREPLIELVCSDGSRTGDFVFESYETGKDIFVNDSGMPFATGCEEELAVTYKDKNSGAKLIVCYRVFEECDVITRTMKLVNDTDKKIIIDRLLSLQLDLDRAGMKVSSFTGSWAGEMNRTERCIDAGAFVIESSTGTSSNRANPFFMAADRDTNEDYGDVYGFNLIYSGNHYESISVNSYGKTRILSGINPRGFSWVLDCNEEFITPEAVMTYSHKGYNTMSHTSRVISPTAVHHST